MTISNPHCRFDWQFSRDFSFNSFALAREIVRIVFITVHWKTFWHNLSKHLCMIGAFVNEFKTVFISFHEFLVDYPYYPNYNKTDRYGYGQKCSQVLYLGYNANRKKFHPKM